ncbi:MAG: membrane protein insertion efficiency factor YidD [Alphaproteobacteria bacterium]|nr:membrane protein insertion efficiency factor YidD [Alphaproteobacteria bacterium]
MGVRTILGKCMQGCIRAYQLLIIPVLPAGGCRFHPSCSHYAVDAIGQHGPAAGGWLALKRILRCHPWGEAGHDPVPQANATTRDTHHKEPAHSCAAGMTETTRTIAG